MLLNDIVISPINSYYISIHLDEVREGAKLIAGHLKVIQNMSFVAANSQNYVNHRQKTHHVFSFANHKVTTYFKLVRSKIGLVTVAENILIYSKVIR